ncbi:MAG: ribulose-phosphate 3-epimerase [Actinobacteria bacterium]|nr:ribulose-phosphate 3-epimerase [Actinomycetota bacterium]
MNENQSNIKKGQLISLKSSISLFSADLLNLERNIKKVEEFADYFHIDIADGRFMSTFLFFPNLVKAVKEITNVPLDVHLAIENPERYIDNFAEAGADIISFYIEATKNPSESISKIKSHGIKAGIAIKPETPVSYIASSIEEIDMIIVLMIDINAKGSREVVPLIYSKIREITALIKETGRQIDIEADGVVRQDTVPKLAEAGATVVVAGSLIFKNDPAEISSWLHSFKIKGE